MRRMPRIAILGATSHIGQHLVSRALERGYSVHVLARDPRQISRHNEQLTVFRGDAETGEGFDAFFSGSHCVVSALGSVKPILERCMRNIVPALETRKTLQRFVMISRLGAGDSLKQSTQASGPIQSLLPKLLAPVFKDINLAENVVRTSKLPYTIFRATRLIDDAGVSGVMVVGPNEPPPHRVGVVPFAQFVIDSLDQPDWLRKEMTVGSK